MTSSRTQHHVVHDLKTYTTSCCTRHCVIHGILTTSRIQIFVHPQRCYFPQTTCRLRPNTPLKCHDSHRPRHPNTYISSLESSQLALGLPSDVISNLEFHVESDSRVNYYDLPMSSPARVTRTSFLRRVQPRNCSNTVTMSC